MILAVLWTLICMIGIAVWGGIVADSIYYWRRLKVEDGSLAHVYFQALLGHVTLFSVLAFWGGIGTVALLFPTDRGLAALFEAAGLFAGPLGLTALGIWIAWSRRRTR